MNLYQLEVFCKVAETGSLAKASAQLYSTQPALSQLIARLENDLGCKLFDRINGRMQLNNNGREFLHYASAALNHLEEGKRRLSELSDRNTGDINILDCGHSFIIYSALQSLLSERPQICVRHQYCFGQELLGRLLDSTADLVVTCFPPQHDDIESIRIGDVQLHIIMPRNLDPTGAYTDGITVADLCKLPMITAPNWFEASVLLQSICKSENKRPMITVESFDFALIELLTNNGEGLAIVTYPADKKDYKKNNA